MAAKTQILGMAELQRAFSGAAGEMQKGAVRRIVAAGANVLKMEARALAQSQGLRKSGALMKNIAVKREKNAPVGTDEYHLGVRHGKELGKKYKQLAVGKNGRIRVEYKNNPYYWLFLEFGHKIVPRNSGQQGGGVTVSTLVSKNGKVFTRARKWKASSITGRRRLSTGFVKATPFIGPALENKHAEALAAMEAQALKEIDKAGK